MDVTRQDLEQVVTETWAPSFELDLHLADDETGERAFTAVVAARGGWRGVLVASTTENLARAVASKMFGAPRAEVGPDDMADAVGELANVVAGNVKSMLSPEPVDLGLPASPGAWGEGGREVLRATLAAAPGFEMTLRLVEGADVLSPV